MRFFAILALMVLAVPSAFAGEAVIGSEVSVDVTGTDAADAREQAMIKSESDALTSLLGKFAPPDQVLQIMESLDAKKISRLVRGREVLEEKITADRYRARMMISYDADAISELVGKAGSGATFENISSATSSFLVIPTYNDGTPTVLWEEKNPWRSAWNALAIEVITGDIVMPYGDSTDANVINIDNVGSANYATVAPLVIRYGVSDVVIVQATYSKKPDMTLSVSKRRINRTRNEINLLTYRADPQETRDMLFARAARDIVDGLQNKKHEEMAVTRNLTGGERNKVMLLAAITTLNSWTQLKAKLSTLPMIDRIELLALSPQQVDMIIYYRGTPDSLAGGIVNQGMRLVRNDQYWVVSRD